MRVMTTVDGNAIAGVLSEVLVGDVTTLRGVCRGCSTESALAETVVELDAHAAIVRCRACTMTLFTVLTTDGSTRLVVGSLGELF